MNPPPDPVSSTLAAGYGRYPNYQSCDFHTIYTSFADLNKLAGMNQLIMSEPKEVFFAAM